MGFIKIWMATHIFTACNSFRFAFIFYLPVSFRSPFVSLSLMPFLFWSRWPLTTSVLVLRELSWQQVGVGGILEELPSRFEHCHQAATTLCRVPKVTTNHWQSFQLSITLSDFFRETEEELGWTNAAEQWDSEDLHINSWAQIAKMMWYDIWVSWWNTS